MGRDYVSERTREEKKMTVNLNQARKYVEGNADKTDREIIDGLTEWDGDIWNAVALVRNMGWSIDRFETAVIGDEIFRENREYIRGVFAGDCDDAMQAGVNFVDSCRNEDGQLDENVTYPEFLQILVNANAPAWPTFATQLEDEAATNAAWEWWQEIVKGQREERRQEAIHEEAKRLDHEEFLRLCEEAKKERNA